MEDLLHKLGVDWRLLIAQIVNFAILFFVLRKVLYRPVLAMLRERRERIAKGLADAEAAAIRRREIDIERANVLHSAEAERRSMLEAAAAEADAMRKQRVAAVELEVVAIRQRGEADAVRTRAELLESVRHDVGDLVLSIARKVTTDRLPATTHDAIIRAAEAEIRGHAWPSR
ncbi:ATP synthase F0 subunit B [Candidatus Uhrbacteria bacterium]|nr:ATP synthase F0 subunit B [Candidatus Uhrbacteria bacterium]